MRIRIRIQQLKLMRIHADPDPDPKPWVPGIGYLLVNTKTWIRILICSEKTEEISIYTKLHTFIPYLKKCRVYLGFEGGKLCVCLCQEAAADAGAAHGGLVLGNSCGLLLGNSCCLLLLLLLVGGRR